MNFELDDDLRMIEASTERFVAIGAAAKYLNARAWTIFGGTDEVQKNIIAKQVLGL